MESGAEISARLMLPALQAEIDRLKGAVQNERMARLVVQTDILQLLTRMMQNETLSVRALVAINEFISRNSAEKA